MEMFGYFPTFGNGRYPGTPAAARTRKSQDLGLETFILFSYPHLEEVGRMADWLFPALGITMLKDAAWPLVEIQGYLRYSSASFQSVPAMARTS